MGPTVAKELDQDDPFVRLGDIGGLDPDVFAKTGEEIDHPDGCLGPLVPGWPLNSESLEQLGSDWPGRLHPGHVVPWRRQSPSKAIWSHDFAS